MCKYFVSSLGGQILTWASILSLAVTAFLLLRANPDIDRLREVEKEQQWAKYLKKEEEGEEARRQLGSPRSLVWEEEEEEEEKEAKDERLSSVAAAGARVDEDEEAGGRGR